jgi:MFS family permease
VATPVSARLVSRVLIGLLLFGAVSSFAGAVLAFNAENVGVPLEFLAKTSLTSFVVPGLILGIVVGGSQLAAAISLLTGRFSALLWGAVAGFGMLIWIFVEMAIIETYSWLQSLYFGLGALELVLVLAMLGIAPALATPWRTHRGEAERTQQPQDVRPYRTRTAGN